MATTADEASMYLGTSDGSEQKSDTDKALKKVHLRASLYLPPVKIQSRIYEAGTVGEVISFNQQEATSQKTPKDAPKNGPKEAPKEASKAKRRIPFGKPAPLAPESISVTLIWFPVRSENVMNLVQQIIDTIQQQ